MLLIIAVEAHSCSGNGIQAKTFFEHIDPNNDQQSLHTFSDVNQYMKTSGVEWNSQHDHSCLVIMELPPQKGLTKQNLMSDIVKIFDVLGWIALV